MTERRSFPTLNVASCACGIMLTDGLTYADMAEIAEFAMGHPIWTHELGDSKTMGRVRDSILGEFPQLPTKEEAEASWRVAADRATKAYGETIELERGTQTRAEHPIDSLHRMTGDQP